MKETVNLTANKSLLSKGLSFRLERALLDYFSGRLNLPDDEIMRSRGRARTSTTIPKELAQAVREEAKDLDLPVSELLRIVLTAHSGGTHGT